MIHFNNSYRATTSCRLIVTLLLVIGSLCSGFSQGIYLEISHPTTSFNCDNGCIGVYFDESGIPPYTVELYRRIPVVSQGDQPERQRYFDFLLESVTVNNLSELSPFCDLDHDSYLVKVVDGLCGEIQQAARLRCECDVQESCSVAAEIRDAQCNDLGSFGGSIRISIDCATGSYRPQYVRWSDGAVNTNSRYNLMPGDYSVTFIDANGCELSASFQVGGSLSENFVNLVDIRHESICSDDEFGEPSSMDGSLEIGHPSGATIIWRNSQGSVIGRSSRIANLSSGRYSVSVEYDGCEITRTYLVSCCRDLGGGTRNMEFEATVSGTTSSATSDGSIVLSVRSEFYPVTYTWTGPNGFFSTASSLHGLATGEYCVRVSDGCTTKEECYTIYDCSTSTLEYSLQVGNACERLSQAGSISIIVERSAGSPSIVWDNGATEFTLSDLSAGEYCFTLTDESGCETIEGCVQVGTSQDLITATNSPCQVIVECNGELETIPFQIIVLPVACDLVRFTCTATGDFWDNRVLLQRRVTNNCSVIEICLNGSQRTIARGVRTYGPFAYRDFRCSTDYICVSSVCEIEGQYAPDPTATEYCATALLDCEWSCDRTCEYDYYCGETYMGSACTNSESQCCRGVGKPSDFVKTQRANASVDFLPSENKRYATQTSIYLDINDYYDNKPPVEALLFANINESLKLKNLLVDFKVQLYPNPASDQVHIKRSYMTGQKACFSVLDFLGRTVMTECSRSSESILDISALPRGMYHIEFRDLENNVISRPNFVKQ